MKYYLHRLLMLAITVFIVSAISFITFQFLPGDPVRMMLGIDATEEQYLEKMEELGLDKPPLERYVIWLKGLTRGDLGTSMKYERPVIQLISERLEPTVTLSITSILLTMLVGIPLGVWLAVNSKSKVALLVSSICQLFVAVPGFWVGILLVLIFSVALQWLPAGQYVYWSTSPILCIRSLILPSIAVSVGCIATVVRYLENMMQDQLRMDYVRTAYSKGIKRSRVLYVHVLRNAMIPVLTMMGMIVSRVLAGSIIVENVFSLPGLGSLILGSINSRDLILLQSLVMYLALIIVIVNTIIDLLYSVVDPRIRIK